MERFYIVKLTPEQVKQFKGQPLHVCFDLFTEMLYYETFTNLLNFVGVQNNIVQADEDCLLYVELSEENAFKLKLMDMPQRVINYHSDGQKSYYFETAWWEEYRKGKA